MIAVTIISLMAAVLTHVWKAHVQLSGRGTNAMVGVADSVAYEVIKHYLQ